MARAFAKIAFTPNVQAAQARMGSRDAYRMAELGETEPVELGPDEIEFIGARDSFYQGTVGENGWPYVQHRGGPAGFLKVLGPQTIGYADFSGNRQYISVGNLAGDDRVSLFLMDYPGQRRLKIWGRARLIEEDTEPTLVARLESPDYRARIERGVIITVEAFDWNCPKYITPRFTAREVRELVSGRQQEAEKRESTATGMDEIGSGVLKLVVTGMRQMTPRVRAYELRAPDWSDLPPVTAGAHLAVPVRLPDGSVVTRQYSLATHPHRRDLYEIAVLREETGRGGSAAIHATWRIGTRLAIDHPANQFPLHDDVRPAVLIAGGIGITPIKAMAQELKAHGNPFELHYSGRTAADMAYRDRLAIEFPGQLHLYFTRASGGTRIDFHSIMRAAPDDALFYVCGPSRLIEAASTAARELAIPAGRVQYESFE
ncbi:MAG: pyridoxamine 5'-phosphate oxidase family protein [Gammaproteobacteria bacterium]|nr:pyridoxamine 5'-phosphate oxidase family protein [Gammaproteobacteria bacterium]MBU1407669.1 pyridoxamine 5'-phosphate oxidase family protein [Gammaproteobacteria bacterium]MBU1531782.1 pyridoxamine 5'-phosphate oxidase family protein [Gammaproteobacteria bacterium]